MAITSMKKINTIIFSFVLVITLLLGFSSSATVYKVGDSDGWTVKDDTYYDWTERKEFHVGDSLVFEYDHNLNDVTQVSGALEYEFCDSSSPKVVFNTGHDVVTLTEPGYHYFITSNHDQCVSGQKLEVLVVHDTSRPIPPPPPRSNNDFTSGKMYKIDDSKRLRFPEESDYHNEWSEEKHVGDNLLFDYGNEVNDLYETADELEFKLNPATQILQLPYTR